MLNIINVKHPSHSYLDYYCKMRLSRDNAIKVSVLTGLATVLTACGIGGSSPLRPTLGLTTLSETPTKTYTYTETTTATETPTPTEIPIYTEAEIEKANVFDAETFPDRFKKVAEDPASYTDKEWQDYQVWTEALRERFFTQEGFTVDLKNIIDPDHMTSLWKMISWQEINKDKVVKEDIRILVTPKEIVDALVNPQQIVQSWRGVINAGVREYGMFVIFPNEPTDFWSLVYPYFNSTNVPGLLLKRKMVEIPRDGYGRVTGDLVGVAWGRYGREDETIILIHVLDKSEKHALFPLIIPNGKIIIPEGTYCIDGANHPVGETADKHSKPLTLPKDLTYKGRYSPEQLLALLGKVITVNPVNTTNDTSMEYVLMKKYGIVGLNNILHPYFGMEMGGWIEGGGWENPSPKWPWDIFPDRVPNSIPGISIRSLGDPYSAVVVEEYCDYQSPACGVFTLNTQWQFFRRYVHMGQILFVFRNYPIMDNDNSIKESHLAALGSLCAGDQNQFWHYHDHLFANQRGVNVGSFTLSILQSYAKGVLYFFDPVEFNQCLNEGKYNNLIEMDIQEAKDRGIDSMPAFFINGKKVVILHDLQTDLFAALDQVIANQWK
jgi:protein-disulfide isomerase